MFLVHLPLIPGVRIVVGTRSRLVPQRHSRRWRHVSRVSLCSLLSSQMVHWSPPHSELLTHLLSRDDSTSLTLFVIALMSTRNYTNVIFGKFSFRLCCCLWLVTSAPQKSLLLAAWDTSTCLVCSVIMALFIYSSVSEIMNCNEGSKV